MARDRDMWRTLKNTSTGSIGRSVVQSVSRLGVTPCRVVNIYGGFVGEWCLHLESHIPFLDYLILKMEASRYLEVSICFTSEFVEVYFRTSIRPQGDHRDNFTFPPNKKVSHQFLLKIASDVTFQCWPIRRASGNTR